jgi:hypothetical protein
MTTRSAAIAIDPLATAIGVAKNYLAAMEARGA